MATECPEALIAMAAASEQGYNDDEDETVEAAAEAEKVPLPPPPPAPAPSADSPHIVGKLLSVKNGPISYFIIEDNLGKQHTFIVQNQFIGNELLLNSNSGLQLKVFYINSYYFDLSDRGYVKQKEVSYIEEAN